MIKRFNVQCGVDKPNELEIGLSSVFKRYNIHQITDAEDREGWEYDETEMSLDEYFRDSIPDNQILTEKTLGELSCVIAMYQEQVDATLGELSILLQEAISNNV